MYQSLTQLQFHSELLRFMWGPGTIYNAYKPILYILYPETKSLKPQIKSYTT